MLFSCKKYFVSEGDPETSEIVDVISALYPFATVCVEAIVKSKFSLSSRAHPDIIAEIMPQIGHEMPAKYSPETELTLVRKGLITTNFEDWADVLLDFNTKASSPSPSPPSTSVNNN